jgi:hypothetical protein
MTTMMNSNGDEQKEGGMREAWVEAWEVLPRAVCVFFIVLFPFFSLISFLLYHNTVTLTLMTAIGNGTTTNARRMGATASSTNGNSNKW